jgi:hypothetical protein
MKNLRPLLSVNSVPAIPEPVLKVPYDIIKVAKFEIFCRVVHGPAFALYINVCFLLLLLYLMSISYGLLNLFSIIDGLCLGFRQSRSRRLQSITANKLHYL